ncbi:MAG: hypothetical protein JXQ75_01170 [Phycisphaerae bacterium]|nr:hypothetical protein [Phycisphaerae bacterium]
MAGLVCCAFAVALSGCAKDRDDWYSRAKDLKHRKEERMRQLQKQGRSYSEALEQWGVEHSFEQVQERKDADAVLEGEELRERIR